MPKHFSLLCQLYDKLVFLQREEHLSTPLPTIFSESIMAKDVDDITTTKPFILLNNTNKCSFSKHNCH